MNSSSSARYDLDRFVDAQAGVYEQALAEIKSGRKLTHWMWFIFPQLAGLGFSAMAQRYALSSLAEALAFWQHPVLGPRLGLCTSALLDQNGRTANEIMGNPDDLKLKSSMTLFAEAPTGVRLFSDVLQKYFAGDKDERTLDLLTRDAA